MSRHDSAPGGAHGGGSWKLAALALVAALALWPLFKYQAGPDTELRLRFQAVSGPLTGRVSFQRDGHTPQQRDLTPADLLQVQGEDLPEGMQELRITLPRRTRAAEVVLQGLADRPVARVTWVSMRSPPLFGDARPEQAFEQRLEGDARHVVVPRLAPGLWNLERVDVYAVLLAWGFLWLVLEARWGQGRAAAFARRQAGWAKYATPPALTWGLLWALFFPGLVSFDPLAQWEQLLDGRYVDWHPAFSTWWMGVMAAPSGSLGGVAGLQLLLFAVVVGKGVEELGHWRVPAWARWGVVAWVALAPAVAINVIAVWKDAPFTLMCLLSVLLLLRAERTGSLGRGGAVALGLCVAALCLLRHNGPVVGGPLLVAALWRYRVKRERLLLAVTAVAAVFLVRVPMYAVMKVKPAASMLHQVFAIHRLGAAARSGDLPPEDVKVLEEFMPLEEWRGRYACEAVGPLIFGSPIGAHEEKLEGRDADLGGVLWRFAKRHPGVLVEHQLCVSRYVWAPASLLYVGPFNWGGSTIDPNRLGLKTRSWLPRWPGYFEDLVRATYSEPGWLRAIFWQPAVSLYLLLAGVLVATWRQRSLTALGCAQTALINAASWVLVSPNPDLRFLFPTLLFSPFFLAFALAPRRARAGVAAQPGADAPAAGAVSREGAVAA